MYDALLNNVISGGECCLDVAFAGGQLVSNVVAETFVDDLPTTSSLFNIDDSRQVFIIHCDKVNSVARSIAISCHYGDDWVAHKVDIVCGEHSIIGNFQPW